MILNPLTDSVAAILRRMATSAVPLIAEYYAADVRAVLHPAQVVVHPSGSVEVCQADAVQLHQYPSIAVQITPNSTVDEIALGLERMWCAIPELWDYRIEDG